MLPLSDPPAALMVEAVQFASSFAWQAIINSMIQFKTNSDTESFQYVFIKSYLEWSVVICTGDNPSRQMMLMLQDGFITQSTSEQYLENPQMVTIFYWCASQEGRLEVDGVSTIASLPSQIILQKQNYPIRLF